MLAIRSQPEKCKAFQISKKLFLGKFLEYHSAEKESKKGQSSLGLKTFFFKPKFLRNDENFTKKLHCVEKPLIQFCDSHKKFQKGMTFSPCLDLRLTHSGAFQELLP